MTKARALINIFFVAVFLGVVLSSIFLQLMSYAAAMNDWREFWIWLTDWVGADLGLTAFACRKELAVLFKRRPRADEPRGSGDT